MPSISRSHGNRSTNRSQPTNTTSRTESTTSTRSTTRPNMTNSFGANNVSSAASTAPERNGVQRAANAPQLSALTNSIQAGNNVQRGSEGSSVRELQTMLNRSGANLRVDGDFGPRTQQAVREYQRNNNLKADGIVGPNTLSSLTQAAQSNTPRPVDRPGLPGQPATPTNPAAPTPPSNGDGNFVTGAGRVNSGFANTRAGRERQAEDILRANGQWPPENGRAYAIQIDQDPPPANASRAERQAYLRSYSGQTNVFRAENGRLVEQTGPLRSASHPGQASSRLSPDVTGDGRGDVAHIRPGVYHYNTRLGGKGGRRFNPIDNGEFRNSARDTNQDGTIDGREANARHRATAIQIHVGNSSRPSSIGCQTLPPQDYNRFIDGVRGANTGRNRDFTYVLVRRPNDQFGANAY